MVGIAQVLILATTVLALSAQRTPSNAQTYGKPQIIQASHKSARRYWVYPPSAYYKRYLRPRYQRRTYTRPDYRRLREYRQRLQQYRRLREYRKVKQYKQRPKTRRAVRKVSEPGPWKTVDLPKGPVQLVISLPDQRMTVYQGGTQVVTSPVSTGRPGYDTPSGIFSVLEKRRVHFSRKYDNAPMPNMQRLTWSGIALHGGRVPGYPASHGCIRLPYAFAKQLFGYTKNGAQVIIADRDSTPAAISHETLLQPTTLAGIIGHAQGLGLRTELPPKPEHAIEGTRLAALDTMVSKAHAADMPVDSFASARAKAASESLADIEHIFARIAAFKARSDAPLRIAVTQWTPRERVVAIQTLLDELGYDPGPADGQAGRRTVGAIKAYEKASSLPVTGMVTDALVASLTAASGRPAVPSGHIYVRQQGKPLFDAAVTLRDGGRKLGTHVFTALQFPADATKTTWTALTLNSAAGTDGAGVRVATPAEALDRLSMPSFVRQRLSDLLTPGSTMIITDNGISNETDRGTDLIVEVD